VFAVEGHVKHFAATIGPDVKVSEFAAIAAAAGQIEEMLEVFVENADAPLDGHLVLNEHLSATFAPLHAARPGTIKTKVEYNGRKVERAFRPNTTIGRVIEWAIVMLPRAETRQSRQESTGPELSGLELPGAATKEALQWCSPIQKAPGKTLAYGVPHHAELCDDCGISLAV